MQQKHENTLVYTQLVEFKNDGLTFKAATTMQQACSPAKGELEYVTALDSKKISFKMLDLEQSTRSA